MTHSKRVEKFRQQLIKEMPRFPNDKASLQELEKKNLTDLLIAYSNWKIRFVAKRPRIVTLASAVTTDARWTQWSKSVADLTQKVQNGDDLTPPSLSGTPDPTIYARVKRPGCHDRGPLVR